MPETFVCKALCSCCSACALDANPPPSTGEIAIPNNKKARQLVNNTNFDENSHRVFSLLHSIMDKHKCQTYSQFFSLCFFRCKFLHIDKNLSPENSSRILEIWQRLKKDYRPFWEALGRVRHDILLKIRMESRGIMNYARNHHLGWAIDILSLKKHFTSPIFLHILKYSVSMLLLAIFQDILNLYGLFLNLFLCIRGTIHFKDCPAIFRPPKEPKYTPPRTIPGFRLWVPDEAYVIKKRRREHDGEWQKKLQVFRARLDRVWFPPRYFNWPLPVAVDGNHVDWTYPVKYPPFGRDKDSYTNRSFNRPYRRFSFFLFPRP